MFLLDTNVACELCKAVAGRADAGVVAWARSVAASSLYLSALSVYELELGVLGKERQDLRQGTILRKWLVDHVLPSFAGRILPLDAEVALRSVALADVLRGQQRTNRRGYVLRLQAVHLAQHPHEFAQVGQRQRDYVGVRCSSVTTTRSAPPPASVGIRNNTRVLTEFIRQRTSSRSLHSGS